MSKVKVWNDNHLVFKQLFKDVPVEIEPGGFILMDYDEAIQFRSYPYPMQFDGMGQQLPESYKKIRVEPKSTAGTGTQTIAYRCQRDGTLHASKELLDAHIATLDSGAFADPEGAKLAKQRKTGT